MPAGLSTPDVRPHALDPPFAQVHSRRPLQQDRDDGEDEHSAGNGDALALIEVDQPLGEDLLMAICALPHITQCKALSF
jgi:hypothetical protein